MIQRWLIVTVSLGLMILLAWLVAADGRSYRESLQKNRKADLIARAIEPPRSIAQAPEPESPEPDSLARDLLDVPAELNRTYETAPRSVTIPATAPAATTSTTPAPADTSPPAPPVVAMPKLDLPRDLAAMSWAEEERIAEALHGYLLTRHPGEVSQGWRRRLNEVKRTLRPARVRKEIPDYEIVVIRSKKMFTFSHFGKYIYLSSSLFLLTANDVELQFCVAREIAHLDAKDFARRMMTDVNTSESAELDPYVKLYRAIADGLPAESEFQSDSWAYRQLIRLGQTPHKALGFLNRYVEYADQSPASSVRNGKGFLDPLERRLEDRWLRLPSAIDRLDKLTKR